MAKDAERQEAYRLFVEEGVQNWNDLSRRSRLSTTTLRKYLDNGSALKDHRQRCEAAKKMYVEKGATDVDAICHAVKIHRNLWNKIYTPAWDNMRADFMADHPALYTTGQLLQQAAELLLTSVRTTGYTGEDVKTLVSLANALQSFKTGEHRLEMVLVGMTEFSTWFRDHAKDMGVKSAEVRTLSKVMDAFRQEKVAQLRAQAT